MREFVVDLRKRLRGLWNADALAEHGEHTNKLAKYHHWMALPMRSLSVHGAPFSVPKLIVLTLLVVEGLDFQSFSYHPALFLVVGPVFFPCLPYFSQPALRGGVGSTGSLSQWVPFSLQDVIEINR
eukprot:84570-Pelagomonas_calceolata.AAC.1